MVARSALVSLAKRKVVEHANFAPMTAIDVKGLKWSSDLARPKAEEARVVFPNRIRTTKTRCHFLGFGCQLPLPSASSA